MIELKGLTKRWPGASTAAVEDLTLTVPGGTSCALIGPSGSGKTTTLRMVNRLIEPSGGALRIDGRDALRMDAVTLRRSIGYVIQEVGLFPHWSIAENVATVPRLLGWPAARIAARVEEVLALTGLDPARFAGRRPHQLSGGERQRVGVARALASDPPVLLMDEPFGAVDPVVRGRLQEEVLRLLKTLRKTVLIVTHDLDEAMRLGDAVAVLRAGRLVQHAPAAELLARPADDFVAEFLGRDRALQRLALIPAEAAREEGTAEGEALAAGSTLRDALAAMLARGAQAVPLAGGGAVTWETLLRAGGPGPGSGAEMTASRPNLARRDASRAGGDGSPAGPDRRSDDLLDLANPLNPLHPIHASRAQDGPSAVNDTPAGSTEGSSSSSADSGSASGVASE